MTPQDEALAQRCRSVADAATRALTWFADSPRPAADAPAVARELRGNAVRARRLAAAAARPMCVGVFGPSQAGKSYLISALARRGDAPLMAMFDGKPIDFVRDINPEGGKESTGLVTRFTIRPVQGLPGMPVALRLLSQTDILKILGNTYLSDFDPADVEPPAPEQVEAALSDARRAMQPQPFDGLSEDDVFVDIREYFESRFGGHALVQALKAQRFWQAAAEIAPRLDHAARAALLGIVWGRDPTLSATYVRLASALAQLGHPDEAFCPLTALMPRSESIIDVETLNRLGDPSDARLPVATRAGARAELPRATLTALIAEVTMQVRDKPWDFFDVTDLLDFPGARSRKLYRDPAKHLKDPANLPELMVRGKVAYLFERYCAESELTAMLLCIGPSNLEVTTLPRMVREWIEGTHGDTPERRARQKTALFFVLTKFDAEFESKAGQAEDSTTRWSTRLAASLLNPFGKDSPWPMEWHPGRPFDNLFWMRNPNFKAEAILDYDGPREIGIRPNQQERIARMREEFLANEEVRRHFFDPARAWDEAMRLNDGGITFLAERLRPVCDPALKRAQVEGRLSDLAEKLRARLNPHYRSGDLGAELARRREAARGVAVALARCVERQVFGHVLAALSPEAEGLAASFARTRFAAPDAHTAPMGARTVAASLLAELDFGDAPPPLEEVETPQDEAEHLAGVALEDWGNRLHGFADGAHRFGFTAAAALTLTTELLRSARRTDLRAVLASDLRGILAFRRHPAAAAATCGLAAAMRLGGFVATQGFDRVPLAQRPTVGADRRPVFAPRQAAETWPELTESPSDTDRRFSVDWIQAFLRGVELNVQGGGEDAVDIARNEALGRIIAGVDAAAPLARAA
jgi:hypothetical protein